MKRDELYDPFAGRAPGPIARRIPWLVLWLGVAGAVLVLDQQTKEWAEAALTLYRPEAVTSWLNLTLAHNYGAAFSFLSEAGGWQRYLFTGLATLITLFLLGWLVRVKPGEWRLGLSLALIIGGAIGNLVDRVELGYVIDFIDVHAGGQHWPAFNVADSAITTGVILMLLDALLLARQAKADPAKANKGEKADN